MGNSRYGDETSGSSIEPKQELTKPCTLNVFEIISVFTSLDLSRMFRGVGRGVGKMKGLTFISKNTASTIVSKLEDIAKSLGLEVEKKGGGLMKIEGSKEGRKRVVGIDVEILEITPCWHLVEMKRSSGDWFEYQKILKGDIKPALEDIVWRWQ